MSKCYLEAEAFGRLLAQRLGIEYENVVIKMAPPHDPAQDEYFNKQSITNWFDVDVPFAEGMYENQILDAMVNAILLDMQTNGDRFIKHRHYIGKPERLIHVELCLQYPRFYFSHDHVGAEINVGIIYKEVS
jgi:hypothetical protein